MFLLDVHTLLSSDASVGRVRLVAEVALKEGHAEADCPIYLQALSAALVAEPPPFDTEEYARLYHSASEDARWMAVSLITNAEREGDGAKRLWCLAAYSEEPVEQQLLKSHAVDESRHSLLYLALLDLAFPNVTDPLFRLELDKLSPHFSAKQKLFPIEGSPYAKKPTVDDFLQMNIAEIRTTIHHIMQRSAIFQHCTEASVPRIKMIQDSLLRDELKHVSYTALLIEQAARKASLDKVAHLFIERFRNFNQITVKELGDVVFDCSVECCAKRPWCRAKAPVSAGFATN